MKATSHVSTPRPRRFALLLLGTLGGLALMPVISFGVGDHLNRIPADGFLAVERGSMEVSVTTRGELQSSSTKSLTSHCEWMVNLLWIADEGTYVEKGEIVALLDSSRLEQRAKEREVLAVKSQSYLQTVETNLKLTELANESGLAKSQLNLVLSKLELAGYKLAEAVQERHDLEQKIIVSKANLEFAQKKYEYTCRMVELGYSDVSQRETDRLSLMRAQQAFDNQSNRLITLDRFSRDRKLIELIAKEKEAERAVERAQMRARAALLNGKIRLQAAKRACNAHEYYLNRLKRNIAACTVRAKQSGQVLYARAGNRATATVKVGDVVRYLQPLIVLPDRTQLELLVRLHESRIRQIAIGQPVTIQVDARNDLLVRGTVSRCGSVPQMGLYPNFNLRDYEVAISLDASPEVIEALAPGLSASGNILVGQARDTVITPLEAIVGIDGRKVAFVRAGSSIEVRDVTTGLISETQVEILQGLRPGDEIVARPRDVCVALIESLRAPLNEADTRLLTASASSAAVR